MNSIESLSPHLKLTAKENKDLQDLLGMLHGLAPLLQQQLIQLQSM